jgi:hypothetical protein
MSSIAPVRLEPVVDKLPADFEIVRREARAEGYAFLDRLADDWASGMIRFDRPGEALLAAYSGGVLAAISASPSTRFSWMRCGCGVSTSAQRSGGPVLVAKLPKFSSKGHSEVFEW